MFIRNAARFGATIALLCFAACGCSRERDKAEHPDIVFIVVDTLRSDRLSCYGYPRPTSPHIDRIAEEGVLFTDCTAQAPWTLPSMSSMLSGKYMTAHRDFPVFKDILIAETFKKAGYRTLGISANSLLEGELGFGRGFDHYEALPGPAGGVNQPFPAMLESLWKPLEAALKRDANGKREPLFLYLQPMDPHFPYQSHPEYDVDLPADKAEPVRPEGWQAKALADSGLTGPADDPTWKKDLAELSTKRGWYDQEVRFVDTSLDVLLTRLKALGVGGDMVLAIVADHGEGLWEHVNVHPEKLKDKRPDGFFFQGHANHLYEEAIRTPFILRGKGLPKDMRVREPVENVDLYPTLCALAGIEAPMGLHGRNLLDLVAGRTKDWRTHSVSFAVQSVSLRDAKSGLKLIAPTGYGAEKVGIQAELYDVPREPDERDNLLAKHAAEARALCTTIDELVKRYPVKSTFGNKKSPEQIKRLINGGYVDQAIEDEVVVDPRPRCP